MRIRLNMDNFLVVFVIFDGRRSARCLRRRVVDRRGCFGTGAVHGSRRRGLVAVPMTGVFMGVSMVLSPMAGKKRPIRFMTVKGQEPERTEHENIGHARGKKFQQRLHTNLLRRHDERPSPADTGVKLVDIQKLAPTVESASQRSLFTRGMFLRAGAGEAGKSGWVIATLVTTMRN